MCSPGARRQFLSGMDVMTHSRPKESTCAELTRVGGKESGCGLRIRSLGVNQSARRENAAVRAPEIVHRSATYVRGSMAQKASTPEAARILNGPNSGLDTSVCAPIARTYLPWAP